MNGPFALGDFYKYKVPKSPVLGEEIRERCIESFLKHCYNTNSQRLQDVDCSLSASVFETVPRGYAVGLTKNLCPGSKIDLIEKLSIERMNRR